VVTENSHQGFLLGIDTGTSKTHALISDVSGKVLGLGEAGCGNYEVVGLDGLISALNESTRKALEKLQINKKDIVGMGFGFSGYDWPSEKIIMEQAIESLKITSPYQFVNDVVIGLIAGSDKGWGIAVDAGTGNNVRGRDPLGNIGRITGNSVLLGEFGGAGEMVWYATHAVNYAWSLRGPQTKITQLFMDFTDTETEDELIEGLAMNQIHLPPILAKKIMHLAVEGDQVAQNVVNFSARELALNVNAVIRQLNLQNLDFTIVLIGSVFKAGNIYLKPFSKLVHEFAPSAKLVKLSVPPVAGAVLLAAETVNCRNKNFRHTLLNSTKQFLSILDT